MVTRSTKVEVLGPGVYAGARVIVTEVVATALTVLTDNTVEVDTGETHVQACGFTKNVFMSIVTVLMEDVVEVATAV